MVAVNGGDTKRQIQCCIDNQKYYFELLPDSVSTVVFETAD